MSELTTRLEILAQWSEHNAEKVVDANIDGRPLGEFLLAVKHHIGFLEGLVLKDPDFDINFESGEVEVRHGLVGVFAKAFADTLKKEGGKNYLVMSFQPSDDTRKILTTLQWEDGKHPSQVAGEAREHLRKVLAIFRGDLNISPEEVVEEANEWLEEHSTRNCESSSDSGGEENDTNEKSKL